MQVFVCRIRLRHIPGVTVAGDSVKTWIAAAEAFYHVCKVFRTFHCYSANILSADQQMAPLQSSVVII
jgi:hypothetical protein